MIENMYKTREQSTNAAVQNENKYITIKQMSKIADRLGGYAQADNYAIVDLTKYKVTEK